jgi:CheY-like chemotaxis protein
MAEEPIMNPSPVTLERPAIQPRADTYEAIIPLALRVLVVDDHRDAADSLAALMEICGADVRVCYNGPCGLSAAETFHPQVGLLDIDMPGMDGCELARELRQLAGSVPLLLVAVTGLGNDATRRRTADAGFDLHYVKPVDPVVLIHTLANFHWSLRGNEPRN